MPTSTTVRLLAVEPDLAHYMTVEERVAAERFAVPVHDATPGALSVQQVLDRSNAFGAFILSGMVLRRMRIGNQWSLRLLGPGDVVSPSTCPPSLFPGSDCVTAVPTRLALLGTQMLVAAQRWPRIVIGLHARLTEQAERADTLLAICQLPRVDQRLLSLMWLLAETWGRVTPHGTRLPMALTHDTLGGLIGARRPTVTLALRELSERGALVRQDDGWLLLEQPPEPDSSQAPTAGPRLNRSEPGRWHRAAESERKALGPEDHEELRATVLRLQEQQRHTEQRFAERLHVTRQIREQATVSRRRIAHGRLTRPPAPST